MKIERKSDDNSEITSDEEEVGDLAEEKEYEKWLKFMDEWENHPEENENETEVEQSLNLLTLRPPGKEVRTSSQGIGELSENEQTNKQI